MNPLHYLVKLARLNRLLTLVIQTAKESWPAR